MKLNELLPEQKRTEVPEKAREAIMGYWENIVAKRELLLEAQTALHAVETQLVYAQQAFGEFVAFTRQHLDVPTGWDITDSGEFFYEMTEEQKVAATMPEAMRNLEIDETTPRKTEEEITAPVVDAVVDARHHCSDPADVTGS